jgi:cytochrome c oxidase subunit 2
LNTLPALVQCLGAAFLAQQQGSFWMPPKGSTMAADVDWLFDFIFWVSGFFFLLIVFLMVLFLVRYRRRAGRIADTQTSSHNLALELTWSGIPLILVIVIFYFGFKSFMNMAVPPANAYQIYITGQKWNWFFEYPNGYIDADLHIPVDVPVKVVLTSEDVIHSFFVPAFRIKKDAVPGRYNKAWFRATDPGEYMIFCAEYCGTGHSDMTARCIVHAPGEFEKWLEKASNYLDTMSPAEAGELLYRKRGCAQCHRVDGKAHTGPSFLGIFGQTHALKDGSTVTVDENYIRQSILEPQAAITAGFEPVMPTYQGRLKDREITALIEYIKTLTVESQDTGER